MISYNKLKHLLIDRNSDLNELCKKIEVSRPTKGKLDRNEYISLDILEKICLYLDVDIGDILEIKKDQEI